MTVVYDMVSGQLIWVEAGRTSDVFSMFLRQLSPECASNIEVVAMDMGLAYQKSVRGFLPNADIVFDRFHVIKNFSKARDNQMCIEFRKADNESKKLMKGCRFLLLKNREKLKEKQEEKLKTLLNEIKNPTTMYVLKEQLQALWSHNNYEEMHAALEAWCLMVDASNMLYMKKFVKSARNNKVGICNYAKHSLISARIEAGNVGIGLLESVLEIFEIMSTLSLRLDSWVLL